MAHGDGAVHLPGYAAVAEVAGDGGAQLRDVERFGEVHLEHGAAAGAEWQQILRGLWGLVRAAVAQRPVGGVGGLHRGFIRDLEACLGEGGLAGAHRLVVAMDVGEVLDELHAAAVAMHVAEAADVHKDVEAKSVAGVEGAEKLVEPSAVGRANLEQLIAPHLAERAHGTAHLGKHDELLRAFHSGHGFRFDILMDIGGFRDMHRHRRCVQLIQEFSDVHGYDEPICPGQPTLAEAGLEAAYKAAMESAYAAYRALHDSSAHEAPQAAQYLLPLSTRCRSMFKMDFAEALYISELRSTVAGHFSYRRVAWEMYRAIAVRHPALAGFFRIDDVNVPADLLKR